MKTQYNCDDGYAIIVSAAIFETTLYKTVKENQNPFHLKAAQELDTKN